MVGKNGKTGSNAQAFRHPCMDGSALAARPDSQAKSASLGQDQRLQINATVASQEEHAGPVYIGQHYRQVMKRMSSQTPVHKLLQSAASTFLPLRLVPNLLKSAEGNPLLRRTLSLVSHYLYPTRTKGCY